MATLVNEAAQQGVLKKPLLGYTNVSCGITMAYGLEPNPVSFVRKVLGKRNPDDRFGKEAYVIFSDKTDYYGRPSNGAQIATFIADHPELGPVIATEPRKNPNSGNIIQTWIWSPNHDEQGPAANAETGLFARGRKS